MEQPVSLGHNSSYETEIKATFQVALELSITAKQDGHFHLCTAALWYMKRTNENPAEAGSALHDAANYLALLPATAKSESGQTEAEKRQGRGFRDCGRSENLHVTVSVLVPTGTRTTSPTTGS